MSTDIPNPAEQPRRRGRMSNSERAMLAATSHTYKPKAAKQRVPTGGAVLALCRLSRKDSESLGDKRQREDIMQLMISDGVDPTKAEFIYEVGSAWKKGKHRPVLDSILQRCESGEVSAVYVYEVSRLTRDTAVASVILSVVQPAGVAIRIFTAPHLKPENDDLQNQMIFQLLVQQAKGESDSTSHRQKSSHSHRAKYGMKRSAADPLGLKTKWIEHELRPEIGVPVYVVDNEPREDYPADFPSPAAVALEMFRRVEDGDSYNRVSNWLNNNNVPTLMNGELWRASQVRRTVMNAVYAGFGTYLGEIAKDDAGVVQAPHEALIKPERWLALQEVLKARKDGTGSKRVNAHRLTGMLVCKTCEGRMHANAPSTYRCVRYLDKAAICPSNVISYEGIELAVYQLMLGLLEDRKALAKRTTLGDTSIDAQIDADRAALQEKTNRLQLRLATETDEDVREGIAVQLSRIDYELQKLGARVATRAASGQLLDIELADIMAAWKAEDRGAAQMIVRSMFDSIEIAHAPQLQWKTLRRVGWPTDIDRVTVVFHNGERINLGQEWRKVHGEVDLGKQPRPSRAKKVTE